MAKLDLVGRTLAAAGDTSTHLDQYEHGSSPLLYHVITHSKAWDLEHEQEVRVEDLISVCRHVQPQSYLVSERWMTLQHHRDMRTWSATDTAVRWG